jgi:uncharacterized protein (TIGR03083 family)
MLTRSEVIAGIPVELVEFGRLVRSLDERQFGAPTRCGGWCAGDVAAHLIGSFVDITSGRVDGQGTPEVSARQVAERAGCTPESLGSELDAAVARMTERLGRFDDAAWAAPVPGYDLTLGQAMAAMWCGTYVHADDIRAAIGCPPERGPGLRASVLHACDLLGTRGWGPAVVALDGLEEVPVGAPRAGARRVTGDPLEFLLAATGRADPTRLGLDSSVNIFA